MEERQFQTVMERTEFVRYVERVRPVLGTRMNPVKAARLGLIARPSEQPANIEIPRGRVDAAGEQARRKLDPKLDDATLGHRRAIRRKHIVP